MFRCNFNFFCNKKKFYRLFVIFIYILYILGIIFFLFVWCIVDILDFEEVEIDLFNIFVYVFIYKNEDVFKLNGLEFFVLWIF